MYVKKELCCNVFTVKEHSVSDGLINFKPTRRVRTAPGGETHAIFGHDEGEDALSSAPQNKPASEVRITLFCDGVYVIVELDFCDQS